MSCQMLWTHTSFNVAASIKMRKFSSIWSSNSRRYVFLQCGRIHKDAEMAKRPTASHRSSSSFNVAASIKMRKCGLSMVMPNQTWMTFNVAASIKMRKCGIETREAPGVFDLQCGRIHKDAEIRFCRCSTRNNALPSMWPHP